MKVLKVNIATKILNDHQNGIINIPSSENEIEKAIAFCESIMNSKKKRPTINQNYCLTLIIAEALCCYGTINTADDVTDIYNVLLNASDI